MLDFHVLAVIPGKEVGEGFLFARRQVNQLRAMGLRVTTFFLETRTNAFELWRAAMCFRRLVREAKADVVHVHYGTVTGLFAAIFSPVPVVISYKGTDLNPSSGFSWPRAAVSRLMSQFAALGAQGIICVSEELRRRLWWRRSRVVVAVDASDLREFVPMERDKARHQLGWPESDRIVLFNHGAARSPNKRRPLVEAAVRLARGRVPSLRLIVMEGEVRGSEVPVYINAADVVVMASAFEGSPNIVREALACNVPICSVRVGDVSEMLAGVANCRLVDATATAIADGIVALVSAPLRSDGRNFSNRFSAEVHTQRVFDLLCKVALNSKAELS